MLAGLVSAMLPAAEKPDMETADSGFAVASGKQGSGSIFAMDDEEMMRVCHYKGRQDGIS
jgi:hypothetical protein